MGYFNGCTALITGASSGLGREFARQLAPHASALVLVARRLDKLEELKAELTRLNPDLPVFIYGLDLADEISLEAFLLWLNENGFQINLLINNAGLGDHGEFATSNWGRVKMMLAVNIAALTRLTHHLLPAMRQMERAAVLNVSSVASLIPIPDLAVYAATKAYVTSFSEAIRAELRGTQVRVTALCPGPVDTEFGSVADRHDSGQSFASPEFFKVPVEQVVRDGLIAVARDRARVIPGWIVTLVMVAASCVPMFLLRLFLNQRKH
jgi:uncharacterized protein